MLELGTFLELLARIGTAFLLGGVIGFERQYRQRAAGLRTNTLVAIGAAVFVLLGDRLGGPPTAAHIAAYVVSGVGFLGAGAIIKNGASISGLTTAATLWGAAAAGACAGAGLLVEAMVAAAAVLAANTTLRAAARRAQTRDRSARGAPRAQRDVPALPAWLRPWFGEKTFGGPPR